MEWSKNKNREAASLAKDLYFVFELKKYRKGEELLADIEGLNRTNQAEKGLQTICQYIQREYSKYKKAPLWSIKYSDCVAEQSQEEKQAFCAMIDGMTNLVRNGYDSEIVYNINLILRIYKFDFSCICNCYLNNNLLEGFRNYILSNSIVYMDRETLNDVINYIKENATIPIYLLSEDDVIKYIEQWQIPYLKGRVIVE